MPALEPAFPAGVEETLEGSPFMETSYALSRPVVPAGAASKLDLLVRFKAGADAPPRRKLNLSLVLDHSGSMAGAPLKHAIQAAQRLVSELTREDRLSIVIYDDTADTIVAPDLVSDKSAINAKLSKVRAAGCTNLSGGWLKGCEHVKKHQQPDLVNRVLLLTDGQANMGITDPKALIATAKQKAGEGIMTTTLGFSSGFNEDLLIGMAGAAEGNFYYIQSPDEAEGVFKIELEGLASVAAQGLSVTLKPEAGASVVTVLNKYRTGGAGEDVEIAMGDVYGVEEKQLSVEIAVPAAAAPGPQKVATLSFSYHSIKDGIITETKGEIPITVTVGTAEEAAAAKADASVVVQASRLRIAKAKDEAVELADKGNLAGASRVLRAIIEELKAGALAESFEIAEEIDQLDHYAQRFEKKGYSGDIRKEMRDQSYQAATRSRGDLALRGAAAGSASSLAAVSSADGGVVVKCDREGGKLRIKVVSEGYDQSKNVQFPRSLREGGVTYLVEGVTPSADGTFYRVTGAIKRLVQPGQERAAAASGGGSAPSASSSSTSKAKPSKPAKTPATAADLETVTSVGNGVLVQCVKEGSKLRARVVSDGFDPNWNIRFPRSIREEGVLYVCDEVVEATGGGSYIAGGNIKKLLQ
jgi:Ca-activated chloride channel family protein